MQAADDALGATLESPVRLVAGRYEILGVLGAGGMGTVYKVRDRELDEIVALKTLRRERVEAPGALERFKREVKLARRVTHRNVARTFDIGEHRIGPDAPTEKYLTMEYVEGRSLAHLLDAREVLPLAEAIRIATEIADALEAAHGAGIVHRDLKPDNVLLAKDGRVVVTDFGIARLHAGQPGDAGVTGVGQAVGTPAYMAPEQVEGREAGAAADLYALGLVLYEMLVGERAFTGDSPLVVAAARLTRPAPDPARVRPDLPAELTSLVRGLLARHPGDRPPSASEVSRVLRGIRAPSRAPSVAPPRPIAPPVAALSLAVYPLRGVGPAEDAWIAEGLSDDLLDALCMIRGLRVKARTAPLADEDARAFGRRLGVDLVVEGSTRRTGDEVRLVLRLASVVDGFQAWATRIDCRIGDLLVVSERAAREIAAAAGEASAPRSGGTLAADPEAIEILLRLRDVAAFSDLGIDEPLQRIERALELAPDHPAILAAYARMNLAATFRPQQDAPKLLERARSATERAIAIAPTLPEPWVALARLRHHTDDTPGAVRALKRAIDVGPSVAEAYDLLGRLLVDANALDDARTMIERAIWLDPSLIFARGERVRLLAFAGDWEAVERELGQLAADLPDYHRLVAPRYAVWSRRHIGPDPLPTKREFEHVTAGLMWRIAPQPGVPLAPDDVQKYMETVRRFPARSRARRFFHQMLCEMSAHSGEHERALEALATSVSAGLEDLAWIDLCPALEPLRGYPELAAARAAVAPRAEAIRRAWEE